MAHLTLAGVSADRRCLLLVSDQGEEFTLDITPGLRAALRGQTTRLGQLEIQMSSTLRPRDIQDRIRGGESPEEVAEAAGTTVDAIMPFVGPVLAEREHIAERAQKSSIRRFSGDGSATGGHNRILGEAVAAHLYSADGKPDQVSWDSYRRDDGRWVLSADYELSTRAGSAKFVYDAPGNYILPDNDDARWLIGDLAQAAAPTSSDDLTQARQRRLSAVSDELPLGDDAIDLVNGETPAPQEPAAAEVSADASPAETTAEIAESPESAESAESPEEEAPREPPRRAPAKKRGRASVPSWDEIMFGGPSEGGRG